MNRYLSLKITLFFIIAMAITRFALYGFSLILNEVEISLNGISIFIIGMLYDFCTILYILPVILGLSLIMPIRISNHPIFKATTLFVGLFIVIFNGIAELIFWDEFSTRFNFIAVDYLIYTDEVIRNIFESYPLVKLIIGITVITIILTRVLSKYIFANLSASKRVKELIASLLMLLISFFAIDDTSLELQNRYENELAHNGIYNLFAAFKNNTLNYQTFYKTIDDDQAFKIVREKLGINSSNYQRSLQKLINNGKAKGYNIILITVESLNANYLKAFGSDENLTPYLDTIAKESILFTNYYATGTRTVRGLEALTLSVPPTPGNSIVRRPKNEHLFSIGSVLAKTDYELKFLYGGYGYFDNMNYFFSNNHFKTIDRSNLASDEVSFANAWGVADEDIFKKAIKEADYDYAKKRNFFYFIMTTSNHRPYTYPENRIDIPSGTGRDGAIKYTDYSIKTLIESAKNKPWFDNTIFVITADHCAGSAGKNDLPTHRYHIPLLIYAPKIFHPKKVANLASQIDVAPTILSLMGISYESKFYGSDILNHPANRAFISTYQKLGYYTPNNLVILGPKMEAKSFLLDKGNQIAESAQHERIIEAVSFYQTASYLFSNGLMKE